MGEAREPLEPPLRLISWLRGMVSPGLVRLHLPFFARLRRGCAGSSTWSSRTLSRVRTDLGHLGRLRRCCWAKACGGNDMHCGQLGRLPAGWQPLIAGERHAMIPQQRK
jgi:hypothetical protein